MGPGSHAVTASTIAKNNGHALLGSLTVIADGSLLNGGTVHMHNDCWDTGVISIHNTKPNKNADGAPAFPAHLYVPSGMIMSTPQKGIVQTNPIPAPINPVAIAKQLLKAGFGKLRNSKVGRQVGEALIKVAEKIHPSKIHLNKCITDAPITPSRTPSSLSRRPSGCQRFFSIRKKPSKGRFHTSGRLFIVTFPISPPNVSLLSP